jgi:hypothetical protein
MIASNESSRHEEVWLLLPWLATGRLSPGERELAQDHIRHCNECVRELRLQRLISGAFTEPDRVTYAPGPSFRKLMQRIDQDASARRSPRHRRMGGQSWAARLASVSLWRPPGLAWAASFLLVFGITGMLATAYHWSEPIFRTHTDRPVGIPAHILHIWLDRSLTIGNVEELLRTSGARIVEGPDKTGILGVTPVGVTPGQTSEKSVNRQLRSLSSRLRSDSRVLWVQPLPEEETAPAEKPAPGTQEH